MYSQSETPTPVITVQDVDNQLKEERKITREKHEKEILKLESEIDSLKIEKEKVISEQAKQIEENENAHALEIEKYNSNLGAIKAQIDDAKSAVESLILTRADLEKQLSALSEALVTESRLQVESKTKADLEFGEIKNKINDLKQEKEGLEDKINSLKKEIEELSVSKKENSVGLEHLQDKIRALRTDDAKLTESVDELKNSEKSISDRISELTKRKELILAENASFEKSLEEIKKQIVDNKAFLDSLKEWESQLKKEQNQLKIDQQLISRQKVEITERERKVIAAEALNANH